jgi:hypothetical protein
MADIPKWGEVLTLRVDTLQPELTKLNDSVHQLEITLKDGLHDVGKGFHQESLALRDEIKQISEDAHFLRGDLNRVLKIAGSAAWFLALALLSGLGSLGTLIYRMAGVENQLTSLSASSTAAVEAQKHVEGKLAAIDADLKALARQPAAAAGPTSAGVIDERLASVESASKGVKSDVDSMKEIVRLLARRSSLVGRSFVFPLGKRRVSPSGATPTRLVLEFDLPLTTQSERSEEAVSARLDRVAGTPLGQHQLTIVGALKHDGEKRIVLVSIQSDVDKEALAKLLDDSPSTLVSVTVIAIWPPIDLLD